MKLNVIWYISTPRQVSISHGLVLKIYFESYIPVTTGGLKMQTCGIQCSFLTY